MLLGQSKWKGGRLSESSIKEGLIDGNWFRNPTVYAVFSKPLFSATPQIRRTLESNPSTVATLALASNALATGLDLKHCLDLIHYRYQTDTVALPPRPKIPYIHTESENDDYFVIVLIFTNCRGAVSSVCIYICNAR
jgi:hypothetical protein